MPLPVKRMEIWWKLIPWHHLNAEYQILQIIIQGLNNLGPLHLTNPGLAYSQILLARIYESLVLVNTVLICFVMRYKRVNPNVFGAYIQWGFLIGILREMSTIKTEHSFTITMNVRFGLCPRESLSPLVLECSFLLVFCHIWSFSRIQCCFRQRQGVPFLRWFFNLPAEKL